MGSRLLLAGRRFIQHAANNHSLPSYLLKSEATRQSPTYSNRIFERYTRLARGIQTQSQACIQTTDVHESKPDSSAVEAISAEAIKANSEFSVRSNLKVSSRHDLAIVYTCKVCETRSMKTCSRESYENGVVVVRCGGCNNLHLIADRLGWFGEPGSVEDLLAAHGEDIKKGSVDSLNLTLEDLAGKKVS